MKTEWTFYFDTKEFKFDKVYDFTGTLDKNDAGKTIIHYKGRIVPDEDNPNNRMSTQSGKLFINLPMSYDEAKPIAYYLAQHITQKISFEFGDFNLRGGLIFCQNIPETPEEQKEVGDAPHCADVSLVEARGPISFNPSCFDNISKLPLDNDLMSQHITARHSPSPIDKFLGFFKILESQFLPKSKKTTLRESLSQSDILLDIFSMSFLPKEGKQLHESFCDFVDSIVHARHRCAHLKKSNKFGYSPIDPSVRTEVEPYIKPLEVLTYETIIYFAKNT